MRTALKITIGLVLVMGLVVYWFLNRLTDAYAPAYNRVELVSGDNDNEADEAAKEIIDIIENRALVEFDRLKTTRDLVDLWRNSKCPGLTEKQRVWYLGLADSLNIV
jgi:hypothetical protein